MGCQPVIEFQKVWFDYRLRGCPETINQLLQAT